MLTPDAVFAEARSLATLPAEALEVKLEALRAQYRESPLLFTPEALQLLRDAAERARQARAAECGGRARAALQELFGYPTFRAGQLEIIQAVMAGRDCLGVMGIPRVACPLRLVRARGAAREVRVRRRCPRGRGAALRGRRRPCLPRRGRGQRPADRVGPRLCVLSTDIRSLRGVRLPLDPSSGHDLCPYSERRLRVHRPKGWDECRRHRRQQIAPAGDQEDWREAQGGHAETAEHRAEGHQRPAQSSVER